MAEEEAYCEQEVQSTPNDVKPIVLQAEDMQIETTQAQAGGRGRVGGCAAELAPRTRLASPTIFQCAGPQIHCSKCILLGVTSQCTQLSSMLHQ